MVRCKTCLVIGSSIDGKISPGKGISSKAFGPFIPNYLNKELHKIRNLFDGILVSSNTVLSDNPSLTVRGLKSSKKPKRIVIDRLGKLSNSFKIFDDSAETLIITSDAGYKSINNKNPNNFIISEEVDNKINLKKAFAELRKRGIKNLLIEGGGKINNSLFKEKLVDKIIVFIFPFVVGGKDTPTIIDGDSSLNLGDCKIRLKSSKKIKDCLRNEYEVK